MQRFPGGAAPLEHASDGWPDLLRVTSGQLAQDRHWAQPGSCLEQRHKHLVSLTDERVRPLPGQRVGRFLRKIRGRQGEASGVSTGALPYATRRPITNQQTDPCTTQSRGARHRARPGLTPPRSRNVPPPRRSAAACAPSRHAPPGSPPPGAAARPPPQPPGQPPAAPAPPLPDRPPPPAAAGRRRRRSRASRSPPAPVPPAWMRQIEGTVGRYSSSVVNVSIDGRYSNIDM